MLQQHSEALLPVEHNGKMQRGIAAQIKLVNVTLLAHRQRATKPGLAQAGHPSQSRTKPQGLL